VNGSHSFDGVLFAAVCPYSNDNNINIRCDSRDLNPGYQIGNLMS
jgi:hypothetical protein